MKTEKRLLKLSQLIVLEQNIQTLLKNALSLKCTSLVALR